MVMAPDAPTGRLLVLGASGMLGHALMHELSDSLPGMTIRGTVRFAETLPDRFRSQFAHQLFDGVDVLQPDSLSSVIADFEPDVVVNAVGVIKQAPDVDDTVLTAQINGLLPHLLARDCAAVGARLVQISTDCVFSGRRGGYTEEDLADPVDFYGRSKLLGEVGSPHLTLRTSIIGPELRHGGSLLEWFLGQEGSEVHGYTQAIYSGLPTVELARVLASVVLPRPELSGLWHLASQPISKFDLLGLIAAEYGWDGRIDPDDALVCDRSLSSTRLTKVTGYVAPSWPKLIREMHDAHVRWTKD